MDTTVYPVVGLGNPGSDYAKTRHNAGFWVLQHLADLLGLSFSQALFSPYARAECRLHRLSELWPDLSYAEDAVLSLIKPLTYMNRSGEVFPRLIEAWERKSLTVAKPVVVVDQMDLLPGELRFKSKGGTAGHNGLKSLVSFIAEDFYPLYVGIGRPADGIAVVDHVLGTPLGAEAEAIHLACERAARSLAICLSRGIEAAMHETNRKSTSL